MRALVLAAFAALLLLAPARQVHATATGPWKVEVAILRPDGQTLRGEIVVGWAVPGTVGRIVDVNRDPFDKEPKGFTGSLPIGDQVVVTLFPIRGTRDQMVARIEIWSNDQEDIPLPKLAPDLAAARSMANRPATTNDTTISTDGGVLDFLGPNQRKYRVTVQPR